MGHQPLLKRSARLLRLTFALAFSAALEPLVMAQYYQAEDLNMSNWLSPNGVVMAMNNSGALAGWDGTVAFVYAQSTKTPVPPPSPNQSIGLYAINDAGDCAGIVYTGNPNGSAIPDLAIYKDSTLTVLGHPSGADGMSVTGISPSDTIVGYIYSSSTLIPHAFSYAHGAFTIYGTYESNAYGIDDADVIVGDATTNIGYSGVEFVNGAIVDLVFNDRVTLVAINGLGVMAGTGSDNAANIFGVTVSGGVETRLPVPPGGYLSPNAYALNDSGVVIGDVSDPTGASHGWVYTGSQSYLIDSLTDNGGNPLSYALAINDQGKILFRGTSPFDIYLLTPVVVHLAVVAPKTATPGTPISATVVALDPSGQVVSADDGSVVVTTSDGLASVPSGVQLTHGTAKFTATLQTAGSQTLTVTDARFPTVTGTSAAIQTFVAPSISAEPADSQVLSGGTITLSITANAAPTPTYQWLFNGKPVVGATQSTYSLPGATGAQSGSYSVIVGNGYGSIQSDPAFVVVTAAAGGPSIDPQPSSQTIYPGETVILSVGDTTQSQAASIATIALRATAPTTYQWYWNGAEILEGTGVTGSQTAVLFLTGSGSEPGSYRCLATNASGSALSQPAVISEPAGAIPGHLINVSCRANVGTGQNALIAGFVLGGLGTSGSENLLVRGSGPALLPFGVTNALPDPMLQVYRTSPGASLIASDFGWSGSPLISSAASAVGAFTWADTSSKDSAVVAALAAGPYTANITGVSGDSGVALAEVYDAGTPSSNLGIAPHLINVSALSSAGTGSSELIAGFVIGGSTSKTVLIRASGPALKAFGVAGTLTDPVLKLFSGQTLVSSNSGWSGNAQIAAIAGSVGAFSWGSSATADSALVVTLPPGAYTAQVSGLSGDSGTALIEIYDVP